MNYLDQAQVSTKKRLKPQQKYNLVDIFCITYTMLLYL